MTSRNPGRSRRRVLVGGVLAAAVALGVWLSQYLGGLGIGLGTGGSGAGKSSDGKTKSSPRVTPEKTQTSRVVEVRVDKQGRYLLKRTVDGRTTFEPVELKRVVELAGKAPGDEHGIKVRIRRQLESDLSEIDKLIAALRSQAGLKSTDIQKLQDFD